MRFDFVCALGYAEVLSKTNSGLPQPSNAVFLRLFLGKPSNGGSIAKEYKTFGEYFAADTVSSESESCRPQFKAASLKLTGDCYV